LSIVVNRAILALEAEVSILKFFQSKKDKPEIDDSGETETVRKIVSTLDQLEPEQAKYIAAFAYLLGRVANADLNISEEETREMERLVIQQGKIPEAQAVLVVQMAKSHAQLFGGTENFLVTREFNEMASRQQKISLLRCLFAVSAADQSISTVEDNEVRQIASELLLDHEEYTAVKAEFRDHLAVLKKP
jgi:uncharacterized tellurite resistance protein B-like protein